ncbi:MAG: hypothetical protein JWP89_5183 [Schlesneria sp.]|nr:hypothetical protein [Schlesneria sp.]
METTERLPTGSQMAISRAFLRTFAFTPKLLHGRNPSVSSTAHQRSVPEEPIVRRELSMEQPCVVRRMAVVDLRDLACCLNGRVPANLMYDCIRRVVFKAPMDQLQCEQLEQIPHSRVGGVKPLEPVPVLLLPSRETLR